MVIALQIFAAKTSFYLEEKVLNSVLLVEQSMEQLKQRNSKCIFFAVF